MFIVFYLSFEGCSWGSGLKEKKRGYKFSPFSSCVNCYITRGFLILQEAEGISEMLNYLPTQEQTLAEEQNLRLWNFELYTKLH